tara:strand:+ start:1001 stop:1195 length:195 start_codon:yes stop_codon:yes gene_type:complete
MKFNVSNIEFDFSDATDEQISQEEKDYINKKALRTWDVDSEDELVDHITDQTGWCISSIDYNLI